MRKESEYRISSVCCIQGVPEERLRPAKRNKKEALLSRDPYEGRPHSLQQRLRTGSSPVVEANPQLSIDDTGMCAYTCQQHLRLLRT